MELPHLEATPISWWLMNTFIVLTPEILPLHASAPLVCAGIADYSPVRYFGLDQPGMYVGVVGLGGFGHSAVKFAEAMGV